MDKIKSFMKNKNTKYWLNITFFFLIIYFSTELLNWNSIAIREIFGNFTTVFDKVKLFFVAIGNFFIFPKFPCSILLFVFTYLIIYGVTNRTKLSCFLVSLGNVLFGVVNYVVTEARGSALTIADVFSVRTAINVMDGITIDIKLNFILGIIIFVLAIVYLYENEIFNENTKMKIKNKLKMISYGLLGIMFFFSLNPLMESVEAWNINFAYKNSGAGLTVMRLIKDLKIEKPEDYSKKDVEDILNQYSDEVKSGELPKVIVVMNESFSDLAKIYNIKASGDNLPFYHKLLSGDNIVSGNMHSSQYGGGTANVEYEFLTQNLISFLPIGAIPFQQYILNPVKTSIVSQMNNLNYNSYGIHSWYKTGYSRNQIYKYMQFDNFSFKEDMPNLTYGLNGYTTDSSTYNYWYDIMENNSGEKSFTFLVTVQNHFPYNKVSEEEIIYVSGDKALNSYMQFAKRSDDALEELINYIKECEEDTILLFFGDHQPNLNLDVKYEINPNYSGDEAKYIVPFFIWANYDIEEKSGIEISANYLQSLLFQTAKLPMDRYTQYVKSVRELVPVITTKYYIDKDGNSYMINDKSSPYYDKVQEYIKLSYYHIFDNT